MKSSTRLFKNIFIYIDIFFLFLFASNVFAITPFTTILPDDHITRIECDYYNGNTYHYDLYIPRGYNDNHEKNYPVIFIFSPGGNATMNNMKKWIVEHQWLAVMLVESQNGPWDPIVENFIAAHDDLINRVGVQDDMKILTGFSGGARASSLLGLELPGIHGVFLQGAGFYIYRADAPTISGKTYIYAAFGDADPNKEELGWIHSIYNLSEELFQSEIFPGGHQWAPQTVSYRALDWLASRKPLRRGNVALAPIFNLLLKRVK